MIHILVKLERNSLFVEARCEVVWRGRDDDRGIGVKRTTFRRSLACAGEGKKGNEKCCETILQRSVKPHRAVMSERKIVGEI